jgi:hypothetical protein
MYDLNTIIAINNDAERLEYGDVLELKEKLANLIQINRDLIQICKQ